MSDVRWEPVEFAYEYRDGVRQAVRAYGQQLQCVRLDPEGPGYDVWTNITLPPDVRLCRATRVAEAPPVTWSQKPPTEEGWYWFVGKLVQPYDYNPQIYTIRTITPMYLFWTIVPVECLIIDHADFIWRAEHAQGYWLPATVPQPPGEVGP